MHHTFRFLSGRFLLRTPAFPLLLLALAVPLTAAGENTSVGAIRSIDLQMTSLPGSGTHDSAEEPAPDDSSLQGFGSREARLAAAEDIFRKGDFRRALPLYQASLQDHTDLLEEPYREMVSTGERVGGAFGKVITGTIWTLMAGPSVLTMMAAERTKSMTDGRTEGGNLLINPPLLIYLRTIDCLYSLGDLEGARQTIREALVYVRKVRNSGNRNFVDSTAVHFEASIYEIAYNERLSEILNLAGEYAHNVENLKNLSRSVRALKIREEDESILLAKINLIFAGVLIELGRFDTAKALYQKVAEILGRHPQGIYRFTHVTDRRFYLDLPILPETVQAQLGMAEISKREGNLQQALGYANHALALVERAGEGGSLFLGTLAQLDSRVRLAKAEIYFALRQWPSCEEELTAFIRRAGESRNDLGLTEGNLLKSRLYIAQGRHSEAQLLAGEALELARRRNDPVQSLNAHLTRAESLRGKAPKEALADLEAAREIALRMGVRSTVGIDLRLADLLISEGQATRGRECLQRAEEILVNYSSPQQHYQFHYLHARLSSMEGDEKKAEGSLRSAISLMEKMRSGIGIDSYKTSFFADKTVAYNDLIDLLLAQGAAGDAFTILERTKGRTLLDMLAQSDLHRHRPDDPLLLELKNCEMRLAGSLAKYEKVAMLSTGERAIGSRVDQEVETLFREYRGLQLKLKESDSSFFTLSSGEPVPLEILQQALDERTILVEYYVRGRQLGIFLMTRKGVEFVAVGDTPPVLGTLIDSLAEGSGMAATSLQTLSALLIEPIADRLREHDTVCFVPTGVLNRLPFSMLQFGAAPIIERMQVLVNPSATIFHIAGQRRTVAGRNALILTDPHFDDPSLALPGARREGRMISRMFGEARLLETTAATEKALKEKKGPFAVYHFATHGIFNQENPMLSYLSLRDGEGEDGRLFANEIFGIDFSSHLVVLSACQSGLVKVEGGDEIMGLNRAFLFSGARTILASLWSIDDAVTYEMMESFFRVYRETGHKGSAFRQAVNATRSRHPDPRHWAAFQLVGAPD